MTNIIRTIAEGREFVVADVVAERLLVAGYIARLEDGKLVAPLAEVLEHQIYNLGICDFCSAPEAPHIIMTTEVPLETLGPPRVLPGGWSACDECYGMVQRDERAALLRRAVEKLAHGKFTAAAIAGLHKRFWIARQEIVDAAGIGAALVDYVDDKLIDRKALVTDRDVRLESVKKLTGLTDDELKALSEGDLAYHDVAKKLVKWYKTIGDKKAVNRILASMQADAHRPLPPGHVPHWQRALDARFEALALLQKAMSAPARTEFFDEAVDLKDSAAVTRMMGKVQARQTLHAMGFGEDVKLLQAADAYSFNTETMDAIREAGKSIPHDSPLSSIETPSIGAGWFWFGTPMPVTASPVASDETHALLWGWINRPGIVKVQLTDEIISKLDQKVLARIRYLSETTQMFTSEDTKQITKAMQAIGLTQSDFDKLVIEEKNPEPAIAFSAYVLDERKGTPFPGMMPSTRWYWPLGLTFHEMIAFNSSSWERSYGPDGPFHNDPNLLGKDETLKTIAELSLFFLAACVWFKQKILVSAEGHIERHARKRFVKEHKLCEQPSVRVVALREAYREPAGPREPGEGGKREYTCRWIVRGHPRLQPCGPGRNDKKLIWIDPYPKGPEDKPLRTREKVYAVIR